MIKPANFTRILAIVACGVPMFGQNAPITVGPPQLTFTVSSTSVPVSPQSLVVAATDGSAVPFTTSAFSTGNWLTVSPPQGVTPQALTVVVNASNLTAGSYGGFITVSTPSSTVSVPVTINVNTVGISPLATTPNQLSFTFATGSTTPQSQSLTVNSTSSTVSTFSVSPVTNTGGNWLTVSPTLATTGSTLTITVNPSTLSVGSYFGSIALNPPGTTGLVVPVQVTVSSPSTLTATPQQLSFAYQIGAATPAAQNVSLLSNSTTPISFTATPVTSTCGGNWLVVSPQSSATPSTLSVQINPSGLQAGTCTGSITISSPGASNPTQSIPVSLLVSTNPLLQVPSTGTVFTYQLGTAAPSSQTIQITSSGASLPYSVTATPLGGGPNFLTVTPATGATPQALTLTVNPAVLANLAPNTYAENVTVTATGAGNPAQSFTVTLTVSNNATLVSNMQAVTFNYQIGQAAPNSQVLTLSSTGAPVSYSVTSVSSTCNGFLSTSTASGMTSYQTGAQPSQIVLNVSTTGLTTPQTCTGTVTLSVPGSTNAPITVPVTLNVSNSPLLVVSPASINITAIGGSSPIQTSVSLTSTDRTTALPFSATAVTNPAGLTWLSVAPNSGSVPTSLNVIVNPNLPAGVYTGSIVVTSTTANTIPQTIPVTLTIATGTATVSLQSLTFFQPVGGSTPGSQTVQIGGVPTGTTIGATASLFNVSNAFNVSTAGNTLTITPSSGASLNAGTYSGVVTVFVPGASNNPIYLPITYTVGAVTSFTATPSNVAFAYQSGGTLPSSQPVTITAATTGVPFTAVAVAAPGTNGSTLFVSVSPGSGTSPGSINVSLIQSVVASLAPGVYTNLVSLTSSNTPGVVQTFSVTLTVSAGSLPSITAILSAASFMTGSVSPGEIISIFGTNIGPATPGFLTLTASGLVSTSVSGTSVTFNGVAAPLIYVSANQINAVVPYGVAGSNTATVVVTNNAFSSASFQVNIALTAPSIFSTGQNGSGQGAILNSDGTVNSASNPAARGTAVAIFGTGEGAITPTGVTGAVTPSSGTSFPVPNASVTVTIGGTAAQVAYAGEAPSLVSGVLQVNAIIPSSIGTGDQAIVMTVGGVSTTSSVTVAVK